jgi:hypothetical protein
LFIKYCREIGESPAGNNPLGTGELFKLAQTGYKLDVILLIESRHSSYGVNWRTAFLPGQHASASQARVN